MQHMIEGKASECWDCNNTTIMSPARMKYAIDSNEGRMLCDDCIAARLEGREIVFKDIDDVEMDDILAQIAREGKK